MKLKTAKLGEICQIGDGAHASLKREKKGIPYLTAKNVTKHGIDYSSLDYISESTYLKHFKGNTSALTQPQKNDILYSIIGSNIGGVCLVGDEKIGVSSSVAIFRCREKFYPQYIYYFFKSEYFDLQIQSIKGGAAQNFMSLKKLGDVMISYPEYETQRRIASILSAYDDLIENNQKQIKLLEEAAQRLYKEWFVDLHFPGYENVKVVDGVPEGWSESIIGDIVCYHDKKRKPLSAMQRSIFQGEYRYYGAAGILDHVKEYLFDGTYLLFGEDGTVITPDGYPVLQYVSGKFWVNNHAHVLTGKEPISTEFLYMMFKKMGISDVVTGVAQPKISQARLSNKKVIIPTDSLIIKYHNAVKPIFDMILNIENQIQYATEARDRLLPKLMSGELEV